MRTLLEEKHKLESQLVEKIREGDENAFERLFFEYYPDLCSFAYQFIKCRNQAKDIVQEVFANLWKRRNQWQINYSVKAYLLKSVRNRALNYIDRKKHRGDIRENLKKHRPKEFTESLKQSEKKQALVKKIWNVVDTMSDRRRSVFTLHRRHGLSYREIGDILNIQRKTVENHMGLALKEIRAQIDMEI